MISVRLLLAAMRLKGVRTGKPKPDDFVLVRPELSNNPKHADDIFIDDLGGTLPDPDQPEGRLLAGVYCRADKELAHLTTTFSIEFVENKAIDKAAQLVEKLINDHLYLVVRETMPTIDGT